MSYALLDSGRTVQVFSPKLVTPGLLCTIQSFPSGSILLRTVPEPLFEKNEGEPILSSLSDAVENLIAGGLADAAAGVQGVDKSELLYDAVLFTVSYQPAKPVPGTLSATVEIRVNVVDTDVGFGSFLRGGDAATQLQDAIAKLKRMAGEAG